LPPAQNGGASLLAVGCIDGRGAKAGGSVAEGKLVRSLQGGSWRRAYAGRCWACRLERWRSSRFWQGGSRGRRGWFVDDFATTWTVAGYLLQTRRILYRG
jgi:hypothetical protein